MSASSKVTRMVSPYSARGEFILSMYTSPFHAPAQALSRQKVVCKLKNPSASKQVTFSIHRPYPISVGRRSSPFQKGDRILCSEMERKSCHVQAIFRQVRDAVRIPHTQ